MSKPKAITFRRCSDGIRLRIWARSDRSAAMRKTDDNVRDMILELILSGWTPQDVHALFAELSATGAVGYAPLVFNPPSVVTVQRIAKDHSLAQPKGGARSGAGRPRGPGRPTSTHRDTVRDLWSQGKNKTEIGRAVGISRQAVQRMLSDGNSY